MHRGAGESTYTQERKFIARWNISKYNSRVQIFLSPFVCCVCSFSFLLLMFFFHFPLYSYRVCLVSIYGEVYACGTWNMSKARNARRQIGIAKENCTECEVCESKYTKAATDIHRNFCFCVCERMYEIMKKLVNDDERAGKKFA